VADAPIPPWDAARDATEWQTWLGSTDRFGILAVNNLEPRAAPLLVPTHFTPVDDQLLLHLARLNPVWPHLEAAVEVRLAVTGDQAYVPGYWRARPDVPQEHGVPTSYYTSVQFVCRPVIVDELAGKAAVVDAQLADLQPEGRHVDAGDDPYARMLPDIRGVRLTVLRVEARFKYDDQKSASHRQHVADRLEQRDQPGDVAAAAQQRRRLAQAGDRQADRSGR